jgi:hypothetical protein
MLSIGMTNIRLRPVKSTHRVSVCVIVCHDDDQTCHDGMSYDTNGNDTPRTKQENKNSLNRLMFSLEMESNG